MEQRFEARAGLMVCCLVFDGGGPTVDYFPLAMDSCSILVLLADTPWISDGVVLVLRNPRSLGERISYRALDGADRLGLRRSGLCGSTHPRPLHWLEEQPQGAKKQITTAVDLDVPLEMPGAKRKKWLEDEAGTTLPTKAASALKVADSEDALLRR